MDVHSSRLYTPPVQASGSECARLRLVHCMKLPCFRNMWHSVITAMVSSLWRCIALEPPSTSNYRKGMRKNVMNALEGHARPWELSFEVFAVVMRKGHLIDCAWAQAQAALLLVRKAIDGTPDMESALDGNEPLPGTMLSELDILLKSLDLVRVGPIVQSARCEARANIREAPCTASLAHAFRVLVRSHFMTAVALRRPLEFEGCQHELQPAWARKALDNALTKPQSAAIRRFMSGAVLCRERQARHAKDVSVSPFCSLCGQVDSIERIVLHCEHLPSDHRRYLCRISDGGAKMLLARVGLPMAIPEIIELGERPYLTYMHQLAGAL
eukprot:1844715-Amphidinium_carterae.10